MALAPGTVLLGTVALEPNRWRTVDPSGSPVTRLSSWLDQVAAAGFDGLELWERHATTDPTEATATTTGTTTTTN